MKRIMSALLMATLIAPGLVAAHPATFVVEKIWEYLGGEDQYEKARYVQFT